jgi:hypothetical protein
MPADYFKWLGMESPPEEGRHLVSSDKYFEMKVRKSGPGPAEPRGEVGGEKKAWEDRLSRTRKRPWKVEDEPEIAGWLKENEQPLALAIEASKRLKYFNPLVSKSKDPRNTRVLSSLIPNVQRCREFALALRCRAMSRVAAGDNEGAWQDLMACQRLARLLSHSGLLIQRLVAIAIAAIANGGHGALVEHGKVSSRQILAWLEELRAIPPFAPMGESFDLGERFMALDSLQSIATLQTHSLDRAHGRASSSGQGEDFWDRLFTRNIDWDQAFRNTNHMYDRLKAAARIQDRESRKEAFAEYLVELQQLQGSQKTSVIDNLTMGKSSRGEYIGNQMLLLLAPALEKMLDAADRAEQQQRNLQLALALAAFRAESGRYPASLEELVPKYLPTVPGDIFSGKPLIYKPAENGYLLYSVGPNGIDDGGGGRDDEPQGDDVSVRVPVAER